MPEKFREVQWTHLPAGAAPAAFAERVQRLLSGGGAAAARPTSPGIAPPHRQRRPWRRHRARARGARHPPAAAADTPSIAVLPFVNMSRDEENEYFADGLAEELLNVLAKIRGLRVAARTSAFSFKGKGVDIADDRRRS